MMKELHRQESLLFKQRSKRIAFHKFNPDYIPTKHRIVITNRSQSKWAKVSNGILRVTANLKDVEQFIRKTYLKIIVYIVEWHQMLFIKQIELSLLTTILISSARGVSIRAPFLPHGSQNSMGFNIGASVSMEGILLNHFLQ